MAYDIPDDKTVGDTQHVQHHNMMADAINDLDARVDQKISQFNNVATLASMTDFFGRYTIPDDGASGEWPNRWEFIFAPNAGWPAHRTFFLNEYGEVRITPARHNTVPLRIFTKEQRAFSGRDLSVPIIMVSDNRDDRNTLFAVDGNGVVTAPNVQNKVVTVPEGSAGWSTQPDGTLWIEYTP